MSELRIYDKRFKVTIARYEGKLLPVRHTVIIEIYNAGQFRDKCSEDGRSFTPHAPVRLTKRAEYFRTMYRVRIDGKWKDKGYQFYTMSEVMEMVGNVK